LEKFSFRLLIYINALIQNSVKVIILWLCLYSKTPCISFLDFVEFFRGCYEKKGKRKREILFERKAKPFLNDYLVQVQEKIERKKMKEAIRKIAHTAEQRIKKLNWVIKNML